MPTLNEVRNFAIGNKFTLAEFVYLASCIVFFIPLGLYNMDLAREFGSFSFGLSLESVLLAIEILSYNNNLAVWFLILGILLMLGGVVFSIVLIKHRDKLANWDDEAGTFVAIVACILLNVILVLLVFLFLHSPILIAFFVILVAAIASLFSSD